MLVDSGKPHCLLTPDAAKVYQKGWYAHCDKKTFRGGTLQYWTKQGVLGVNFDHVSNELPFVYHDVAPPDVLAYQDRLPSCPYWQWHWKHEESPAAVVWTDGSRRDLGPKIGLRVGYGSHSTHQRYCLSGRVGGEAVPIRGEYATIAMVLPVAPPSQPLAILTDCL
eukprot:2635092-Rhodomonas_salina.2